VLALYIVVYLLVICDILLTYYGLTELGLQEQNSFVRMVIERLGFHGALAVNLSIVSLALVLIAMVRERAAVIAIIAFYSAVVAFNAIYILIRLVNR